MWGIARREDRVVQSEDVNGGGLQRRGEEYSSEENCEKGKGEVGNLWYVTEFPAQVGFRYSSVFLLLGKESNLSSEQHLGFSLTLSGFQN